jgi:regulatory protein
MGDRTDVPAEERAREVCLRALERRMHSRRELELKLRQKGIDGEVAAPVLDRLAEVGLIDDEAFARSFVAHRQRSKPRGSRALSAELRRRGVSAEVIERVLREATEEEDAVEAARRAAAPKLRALRDKPAAEARRKAEQFLLRRGFDYGTIRAALGDPEDA